MPKLGHSNDLHFDKHKALVENRMFRWIAQVRSDLWNLTDSVNGHKLEWIALPVQTIQGERKLCLFNSVTHHSVQMEHAQMPIYRSYSRAF